MPCFHIVSLDDERDRAKGNLSAATEKLEIGQENSIHFSCSGIYECKAFIEANHSDGEWIFVIDCDLSRVTDPHIIHKQYGGFQVWSEIVAMFPSHRQPFAAIYSQKITNLIDSAWKGGEYSRKLLNPKLYKMQTGDFESEDKHAPALWSHCNEWVEQRQAELLLRIEPSKREEAVKAMRQFIANPEADSARALGERSLPISIGKNLETWKVRTLFPKEWSRFSTKQDLNYLLEICFKLQSQLPAVWHDFARLLFDDHRGSQDKEFSSLGTALGTSIEHVIDTMNGGIKDNASLVRAFSLLKAHLQQLSHRQEKALECVPLKIRSILAADPICQIITEAAEANTHFELAQKLSIGGVLRECDPFSKNERTASLSTTERTNFKKLPITPRVAQLIKGTLDNNCRKHGAQQNAAFLGQMDMNSIRWFCFRTQERGSGTSFEADVVKSELERSWHDPQPDKLSGLIEIVCGQYSGKIYVLQEPMSHRKSLDSAASTIYMFICAGKIELGTCESVPNAIAALKEKKVKTDEGKEKVTGIIPMGKYGWKSRPAGTFYLLGFPLCEDQYV
jgi:molybdopterin-guanine dinucleotide biosynthesis protein A